MRIRKSTKKQQAAVRYCEQWLGIKFDGNINSFNDCSYFLKVYLDEAKQTEIERYYPFGGSLKPSTDIRDWVKASALIAAAIAD